MRRDRVTSCMRCNNSVRICGHTPKERRGSRGSYRQYSIKAWVNAQHHARNRVLLGYSKFC